MEEKAPIAPPVERNRSKPPVKVAGYHPLRKEAGEIFKTLGAERTIAKVRDVFIANGVEDPPKVTTLKAWSTKDRWNAVAHEFDLDVARLTDQRIKEKQSDAAVEKILNVGGAMRSVSSKILKMLEVHVPNLKIKTGAEARAIGELAVSLNKAAEVLDGGVSDRTETVRTVEERMTDAEKVVANAFKQFRSGGGQDNGKRTNGPDRQQPVDNAADVRTGTGSV